MTALQAGDDTALTELMNRWSGRVAAYLQRLTGEAEVALELAQEVFVRVYQHRARYRPRAAFSTWLFTIATNLARQHRRWRGRHPTVSWHEPAGEGRALPEPVAGGLTPAAAAVSAETLRAVEAAFAALPLELREAMSLFIYEGLSYVEIAAITGGSPKAVETRIYRARQKLKTALAEWREK